LWLDKFLPSQTKSGSESGKGEKAKLILAVQEKCQVPDDYREAYERWQQSLVPPRFTRLFAQPKGRLVVGLGAKGSLETGLTLHRTWGVPFLPGSALKGLAAAAAHHLAKDDAWRKGGESHKALFGTTDESGCVNFLDALWIPEGARELPIWLDTMTVHHKEYYEGAKDPGGKIVEPSDMDSPVPIPFATVAHIEKRPARFLVALESEPEAETTWRRAASHWLEQGLAELGLGAKTNAGYGRMALSAEGDT
jgi:CRISPR-associated protein Cmr6